MNWFTLKVLFQNLLVQVVLPIKKRGGKKIVACLQMFLYEKTIVTELSKMVTELMTSSGPYIKTALDVFLVYQISSEWVASYWVLVIILCVHADYNFWDTESSTYILRIPAHKYPTTSVSCMRLSSALILIGFMSLRIEHASHFSFRAHASHIEHAPTCFGILLITILMLYWTETKKFLVTIGFAILHLLFV